MTIINALARRLLRCALMISAGACARTAPRDYSVTSPPPRRFAWPAGSSAQVVATDSIISQFGAKTDTMVRSRESELTVLAVDSALLIRSRTIKGEHRDPIMQGLDDLRRSPFLVSRAGDYLGLNDTVTLLRRRDELLAALKRTGDEFVPFANSAKAGYAVAPAARASSEWWDSWVRVLLRDSSTSDGRSYAKFERSVPCPSFAPATVCDQYRLISPTPPMTDLVTATKGDVDSSNTDRIETGAPATLTSRMIVDRATLRPLRATDSFTSEFVASSPNGTRTTLKNLDILVTEFRWRAN